MNHGKLAAILGISLIGLQAYPAFATDAYRNISCGGKKEAWSGLEVPGDENYDTISLNGRLYSYLYVVGSIGRPIRMGVTQGKNWGYWFKEYYVSFVDGNGSHYVGLGGAASSRTKVGLNVWSTGGGNWKVQVNDQYGHQYGPFYTGDNWIDVASVGAMSDTWDSSSFYKHFSINTSTWYISYAWFSDCMTRDSSTSYWYYWPSATYGYGNNGSTVAIQTGTVSNGQRGGLSVVDPNAI